MSEQNDSPDSFDAEYVRTLRSEAAKYRNQTKELRTELDGFKGLEAQLSSIRVENEFIRRGIDAEPGWVSLTEGQSPSQAVDNFLEKYPQFAANGIQGSEVQEKVEPKAVPKALSPKKSNIDHPPSVRGLDEIRKDPSARSNFTDLYRDLLKKNSNQKD